MICIILRNIDTETADYELLLFGYLKVVTHFPYSCQLLIPEDCKSNVAPTIWHSDRCNLLQRSKRTSGCTVPKIGSPYPVRAIEATFPGVRV